MRKTMLLASDLDQGICVVFDRFVGSLVLEGTL